jgi:hypothetical protein
MGSSHPKGEEACTEGGDEETSFEKAEVHKGGGGSTFNKNK